MACQKLAELRKFLKENGYRIYAEHEEKGWVNVVCPCGTVHEVVLEDENDEG